jgi:predicted nucleic acid-binding Zn ribbon protein
MTTDPKLKKFTHIGDILAQALESIRKEKNDGLNRIGGCWPQVVGELLALHSSPDALKGKILRVRVATPVWLQEMRYRKAEIIEGINGALGEKVVSDIKFRVG